MEGKKSSFELSRGEGEWEIVLKGEIDHHNALHLRSEMDELIARECPRSVVFDLSEIDFMDSSGLGLIMGRYALLVKMGGTLRVKNPNERILKIFELANLGRMIPIEMTKEEEG